MNLEIFMILELESNFGDTVKNHDDKVKFRINKNKK